jgi:hypothetical protein
VPMAPVAPARKIRMGFSFAVMAPETRWPQLT